MRKSLFVMVALALLVGCNSTSSKELNENNGRQLIQTAVSKEPFLVFIAGAEQLMHRGPVDYSGSSTSGASNGAVMRRLLDQGAIKQQVGSISYPRVSGKFELPGECKVVSGQPTGQPTIVLTLENNESSNGVVGEISRSFCQGQIQKDSVKGIITPEGALDLTIGGFPVVTKGVYEEHGNTADIKFSMFSGYPSTADYKGTASGKKVDVRWYEYSLAPETQSKLVKKNGQDALAVGSIDVGDVSGLRLENDTRSLCSFSWSVKLNDLGAALLGKDRAEGQGSASFDKKPDGSWVVKAWNL